MKQRFAAKLISLTAAVGMLIALGSTTVSAAEATNDTDATLKITFFAETKPREISEFVETNEITLESFTVKSILGITECTSGYVINEQLDFESMWDEFVYMQTALLSEGIESFEDSSATDDMSFMLEAIMNNDVQTSIICENADITQSYAFVGSEIIESVEVLDSCAIETLGEDELKSSKSSYGNWLPTYGWGGAWPSSNVADATYLEVSYRWDYAYQLAGLTEDEDSTFEADLVLYNYDNTAMATDWYSGNYTYNTNQPRPYRDTKAFDNDDEPVFCIGCSDAASLVAGKDYYWIAYGNETGSSSCKAKLNLQRGHRVIDSIYEETWNIFGDETITAIPFSSWNTATDPKKYFQFYYV
ncbi:MAG: hypothetical protein LUJ09_00440 [Firmicutes bacterium]|nr:hypothetical protein [Bacillota bacterium]